MENVRVSFPCKYHIELDAVRKIKISSYVYFLDLRIIYSWHYKFLNALQFDVR